MPVRTKTVDYLETLLLGRILQWQSFVLTGVCPTDFYAQAVVRDLIQRNEYFIQEKITFRLDHEPPEQLKKYAFLHHPQWVHVFMIELFSRELFFSIWGRLFLHWLQPSPFSPEGEANLKLPYILHPTHCPFCDEDLGLGPKTFKKAQLKCSDKDCDNQWQTIRHNLHRAVTVVINHESLFQPEQKGQMIMEQMACIWESYQDLCRFLGNPKKVYTPRYTLFKEYQGDEIPKDWYQRLLCEYSIDLSELPMFTPEIQGRPIIEGYTNSFVETLPEAVKETAIRFEQLDDEAFFIIPSQSPSQKKEKKSSKRRTSSLEHIF